jgi:DNA-binding response OmpR family regulator
MVFLFSGEPLELMLPAEVLRPARGQPNSRTLDQHISKLRKLIEKNPQNPEIILTVHGVGYRYDT